MSRIEWTDETWNPVTGCTKVSAGCKNCYAETMAHRLQAMGQPRYKRGFLLTLQPDLVNAPRLWKKPRRVFVNSMSDLFHPDVPDDFILECFGTMNECPHHQFQILTKRPERVREMSALPWGDNIWMGTSVEDMRVVERITHLQHTAARVKFLSCEPLLGALPDLDLRGIDWVIVGGESGRNKRKVRPMQAEWARDIRDQCVRAGVPFFFKQWGGTNKQQTGRLLDGRTWDEYPRELAA